MAAFVIAMGYRLWSILLPVPPLGGDEGVIGIVARHIAEGRAFPAYFYGQHYMGALEAYLAAPFIAVSGNEVFAVRAATLLLFACFFWSMYWLCRQVFSPWLGAAVAVFLVFASDRLLHIELMAAGGYPDMLFLGTLLAALTVLLCRPDGSAHRGRVYVLWGLCAGIVLWSDPLIVPFLAAFGVMLLVLRRGELWGRYGLAALGGLLTGALPLLLSHPVRTVDAVSAHNPSMPGSFTLLDHLGGTRLGVALAFGLCNVDSCPPWQQAWGWIIPLLLVAAAVMAVAGLRRGAADPGEQVRDAVRLALVAGAAATILLYAQSVHSVGSVWQSSRYLSNVLIATPVVLWPLWTLACRGLPRAVGVAGLATLAATACAATISVFVQGVPAARRSTAVQQELVAKLDSLGVNRFYTDFFTCHRLIYATNERLICAVIEPGLRRGWDRYEPYRQAVTRSPLPAYVLGEGTPEDRDFQAYLRQRDITVEITTADGYRIYRPAQRLNLPAG
jgi:hypothetical protein